jgi:hypothetical protein
MRKHPQIAAACDPAGSSDVSGKGCAKLKVRSVSGKMTQARPLGKWQLRKSRVSAGGAFLAIRMQINTPP